MSFPSSHRSKTHVQKSNRGQTIVWIIGLFALSVAFCSVIWLLLNGRIAIAILVVIPTILLFTIWINAQRKVARQEELNKEVHNQNWLKSHLAELFDETKGLENLQKISEKIINKLSAQLGAGVGAFYINDGAFKQDTETALVLKASYAFENRKKLSYKFLLGQGIVGQAALERKTIRLSQVPENYITIQSGIGESAPTQLVVTPILHNDLVVAVIEMGFTTDLSPIQIEYLKEVENGLGISIHAVMERAKTEQLSIEVNNRIQAINRSNAAIEFDLKGNIISANSLFLDLMGYKLSEIKGKHHSIFVDKTFGKSDEYKNWWKELSNGTFMSDEFKRQDKSGNEVWIQGSYNPLIGADGKPYRIMKIATDITSSILEQQKSKALSLEITNQMQAINRSNAVIEFDLKGIILAANDIFLDLMGYELDQIVGQHHSIFVDSKVVNSEEYKSFWAAFAEGRFISGEFERFNKSGASVWINGNYNPILGLDGKPYKVIKMATDITERKKQEEAIKDANMKLKAQEEELRVSNEELHSQTQMLQASEEELRVQQEEMAQLNAELEEKASLLEERNISVEEQNQALSQAREALDIKASELEKSSKYKSEFLSNMSHELRTPLNSILILSKLLSSNKDNNLTDKQIEFAHVIQKSGADLLSLINEVLDLAKVESGKIELEIENHKTHELASDFETAFKAIALEKKIMYQVHFDPLLPEQIQTDKMRFEQVIKNLLSNAFKFTPEQGQIDLSFKKSPALASFRSVQLLKGANVLEVSVKDSGIGIAEDKHHTVFQAFQQADGSTQRKYGGTGLGLSISKELVEMLGGEIHLHSAIGSGAKFTVFLPLSDVFDAPIEVTKKVEIPEKTHVINTKETNPESTSFFGGKGKRYEPIIADDRLDFAQADKSVLIVEDDLHVAKNLLDFARGKGFAGLVVNDGLLALKYVEAYLPKSIILDMKLPGLNGWDVLKKLKNSPYSHIPVHVMSGMDRSEVSEVLGAVDYLVKPISTEKLNEVFATMGSESSRQAKHILIIEDDQSQNMAIKELIAGITLASTSVYNGKEALNYLNSKPTDLVILDMGLPDTDGLTLLKEIRSRRSQLPIIVFTGKDLTKEELTEIEKYKETSVVLKTNESYKRLLEETELFIHHIDKTNNTKTASQAKPTIDAQHFENTNHLKGRKILMVDDDMRNIYALQTVLEAEEIETVVATNGFEAVEIMKNNDGIDAILMDIMMPEMDGYEATQQIRELGFKDLPIIALTAKAMKGDREKTLEAGLSDYMSKPLDVEKLLSLLNVWLYKDNKAAK